jgi:colanic acid/amylovoran biosynthesis glycosyltransferase
MKLTYVLADYPVASERFITREIEALRAFGTDVRVVAIRTRPSVTTLPVPNGIHVDRPPSPGSPGFWAAVVMVAVRWPARCAALFGLACSLDGREGIRGFLHAFRLALIALYFARTLREQVPDIIHAHFASAPTTLGLLLSHWFVRPFGFSVHAYDVYAERNNLSAKAARARHVIACSNVAANDIRSLLPAHLASRVHAIPHGVESPATSSRDSAERRSGEPLILAVGRFEAKKGFGVLVDACGLLRDKGVAFRCEIVGAGLEEGALRDRIHAHRLMNRVRIIPWQSQDELACYYDRADALAVPSVVTAKGDRDNIPNVILEGMASGVPVIASDLPALMDVLGPTKAAILVSSGDASALADGLCELLNDRSLAEGLRARGRQLVRKEFDLHTNAHRLLDELVKSLAPRPPSL